MNESVSIRKVNQYQNESIGLGMECVHQYNKSILVIGVVNWYRNESYTNMEYDGDGLTDASVTRRSLKAVDK